MRELGLTGLSEDGRFLVAHDPLTNESFHIPTDRRLTSLFPQLRPSDSAKSVKRPDHTAGAREPSMDTSLSPRDIQARIRRGESPEQVADESGMALETIQGFAVPVIAEREYIVEQARRTAVRRQPVGGSPGMLLGDLVDNTIAARGQLPEDVPWDSWRREDGRWTVVASPAGFSQPATFLFDTKGRYVLPADEPAHELVGNFAFTESSDMAIVDALREASAVANGVAAGVSEATDAAPAHQPTLDELDLDLPAELTLPVQEDPVNQSASVASIKEARDRRAQEQLAEQMALSVDAHLAPTEDHIDVGDDHESPRAKSKHERRRVPSWDEIMFGGARRD